jgi:hypothetical protein
MGQKKYGSKGTLGGKVVKAVAFGWSCQQVRFAQRRHTGTVAEIKKAQSLIWAVERLLGAKSGSLGGLIRLFDGLDQANGPDEGE